MKKNIFAFCLTILASCYTLAQQGSERSQAARDSAYLNPARGISELIAGNRRFYEQKSVRPRQDSLRLLSLETGQQPFAVIVGCSDSRVPNEIIFDQGLGDLFIIRTAGQVSADASYASMEYAVLFLKTRLIVVLGHTECGAVSAAVKDIKDPPGHIGTLIENIRPALQGGGQSVSVNDAVRRNVIRQVENLKRLAPVLKQKNDNKEIMIVGAVYNIHTGRVEFLTETM
ncbi:carbonate dehydratase [Flavobacterium magnum]|uniref:Carbonic anhydrase n=1 Tax=Flavobacterium magnum TaxID=2162713 RepID=A0A2S0REY3_9FLAO|nr:carbonic anhydrase [Flavobacterium magnum]AWA30323.1 carbonate dehydratase [Flavobacterium magnum]